MQKIEALAVEQKGKRNLGIDLLRLISMFMIVTLHVLGVGGVLNNVSHLTLLGELVWGLEIACFCAVNIYAIISGYVGLRSRHRYSGLILLCLQLVFYSVVITGAELIMAGGAVSPGVIFNHLLPSINSLWYFSAYFCLFFFMPILNGIVEHLPRNVLKTAGAFIFIVFCGWGLLRDTVINLRSGYSVLWLAILYVVGAYMAKYKPLENCSVAKSLLGYVICVALTVASRLVLGRVYVNRIGLLISYTSPTVILAAIFLINAFSKMNLNKVSSKIVAILTPLSFGVYLIHCHPFIVGKLDGALARIASEPFYYAIPLVLGIALAIFVACLMIDWLRHLLFRICRIKKFSEWVEKLLGKIFAFVFRLLHISFEDSDGSLSA